MTAPTTTDLSAALQETLVELIDLSLQAKHYHWNVTGQEFRGVHLHLDEITDQVRLWYDDVAERLATLDVAPDGRLSTIAGVDPPAVADRRVAARLRCRLRHAGPPRGGRRADQCPGSRHRGRPDHSGHPAGDLRRAGQARLDDAGLTPLREA